MRTEPRNGTRPVYGAVIRGEGTDCEELTEFMLKLAVVLIKAKSEAGSPRPLPPPTDAERQDR